MATTLPEHRETLLRLAEAWIKVAQEATHSAPAAQPPNP